VLLQGKIFLSPRLSYKFSHLLRFIKPKTYFYRLYFETNGGMDLLDR
jgi:hypothetical protein